jgi:hypothetical protein
MSATMRRRPPTRSRRALLRASGLAAAVTLAACGSGEVSGQASAGSSAAASGTAASSASLADAEDLSAGLLPVEAFPDGTVVTPVTREQLQQQSQVAGGSLEGLTVTPESCTQAVQGTQPGLDDVDCLAAQTATLGSDATVEVLASGEAVADSVDQLTSGVADCPQATVTSPQFGTATIAFSSVDAPDLGDGVAVVSFTTSVTSNGQAVTVPALIGLVQDGDRVVTLVSTSATGAADPAPFLALLQQAYEHQADALD